MTRANRVSVKMENGRLVATFKKTHKVIMDIHSELTGWELDTTMTKTGQRESFRMWVIEHAGDYEINYQPEDMRDSSQIRKAHYTTDEELLNDVTMAIVDDLNRMTQENKHDIEWGGIYAEEIVPMTYTGKGTPLEALGIEDGKYRNSRNWAWATVNCSMTIKFKGEEVYVPLKVELVSGQIKKPKINKTEFNKMVEEELIAAGLATAEELNPPKEDKKEKNKEVQEDNNKKIYKTPDDINKMRKRVDLMEYANMIEFPMAEDIDKVKFKDLKEEVIRFQTEQMA